MTKMNTMRNLMDGYFDDDDDSNIVKQQEITRSKHRKDEKHKRASRLVLRRRARNSMRRLTTPAQRGQSLNRLKRVLEPINDALTRVDTARRAALRFAASISEGIDKFAISKRIPVLIFSFSLAAYEATASTLKPPDGSSHSIWPESYNPAYSLPDKKVNIFRMPNARKPFNYALSSALIR